jgi:hypothetical protein
VENNLNFLSFFSSFVPSSSLLSTLCENSLSSNGGMKERKKEKIFLERNRQTRSLYTCSRCHLFALNNMTTISRMRMKNNENFPRYLASQLSAHNSRHDFNKRECLWMDNNNGIIKNVQKSRFLKCDVIQRSDERLKV